MSEHLRQAEVMRLHHSVSGDMIQVLEQMHFQVIGRNQLEMPETVHLSMKLLLIINIM